MLGDSCDLFRNRKVLLLLCAKQAKKLASRDGSVRGFSFDSNERPAERRRIPVEICARKSNGDCARKSN